MAQDTIALVMIVAATTAGHLKVVVKVEAAAEATNVLRDRRSIIRLPL